MMPREATIAAVEEELPALVASAARRNWAVNWSPNNLTITADGRHAASQRDIRLQADVSDYRALPPVWTFVPPGGTGQCGFPEAGTLPGGVGSIFHSNNIICAPFSRLAYQTHGGPHKDWNGPAAWLGIRGYVRATTLADMFCVIVAHLRNSPGWRQ